MDAPYTKQILVYILIFFFVTFTTASMESGYYLIIPYLEGIGADVGSLGGILMGICYGISFILRPFVPYAERLIGRERLLRFSYGCFFISAAGTALFARTAESAAAWRALSGFGFAVVTIALQGYEYQLLPEAVRGRCLSLITVAYSLPAFAVVPTMEYLIGHGYYAAYIFAFPAIAAAGFFAVLKLPKADDAPRRTTESAPLSYLALLRSPQPLFFALCTALFAFADAGQLRFVQLAGERGIAASYFFSTSACTAMIFRLLCGRLVDRLPRKIFAPASAAVTSAMMFALTFATERTAFIFCGFIFGVAMGFGYPAFMCLTIDIGGRRSSVTALAALFGFIYSMQYFVSPVLMEHAIDLTGSVTWAYRAIYGAIFPAAAATLYFSPKIYRDL